MHMGKNKRKDTHFVLPPDEADNHLVELALAGGAAGIVTHNVRDLGRGELVFDQLRVLTPAQCLEEWQ